MPVPRLLVPDDAAAFCVLRRAALLEAPWAFVSSPSDDMGGDVELIASKLAEAENAIAAIADEDDPARLVAVAGVYRQHHEKDRHRANIWGVYCEPTYRGRGLGRAVVEAAMATARSWPGVEIVGLSVSTTATAAIRLYESLGFEAWGIEPDSLRVEGQRLDVMYMARRL